MHTLTTAPPSSPQVRPWAQAAVSALPAETHADAAVFVEAAFSAEALREVAETASTDGQRRPVDERARDEAIRTFVAASEAFGEACRRKRSAV